MKHYSERVITSLGGRCPYNCNHCYAHDMIVRERFQFVDLAISSIENKQFDIIYVSEKTDPFYDEAVGVQYISKLYERFKKDIFIITRSHLSEKTVKNLSALNNAMQVKGNSLRVAESICAASSYGITEDVTRCPTPDERIETLKQLHSRGIQTILFLRPVFPDCIIPVVELKKIINLAVNNIDAVVGSGLIVTDGILKRLKIKLKDLPLLEKGDSTYLDDLPPEKVYYVDVKSELEEIRIFSKQLGIPFFKHSMDALNYCQFMQYIPN